MPDATDTSAGDEAHASGPNTEGAEEGAPGVTETTECPACGHQFVGDYCPNCGQEADPSVTVGDVAGDFIRELTDVKGGFLTTLVGLTRRPGRVLRKYLDGVRAELMSPGRYLLVSVLLVYFVGQGLIWAGLVKAPEAVVGASLAGQENVPAPLAEALTTFIGSYARATQAQWYLVAQYLLATGILALILRRLFGQVLHRTAEALAVSAYLVGHFNILWSGVNLVYVPATYLWTGRPMGAGAADGSVAGAMLPGIGFLALALYAGAALYDFGGRWWGAVKGVLGALWSLLEASGGLAVLTGGYLFWRLRPFADVSDPGVAYVILGVTGAGFLLPILLHGAVEAYYRLR